MIFILLMALDAIEVNAGLNCYLLVQRKGRA